MKEYVVCPVQNIPEGQGVAVRINQKLIAIFQVNGKLRAMHNRCMHKGASMAEGYIDAKKNTVLCPWHLWEWDLETGRLDSYDHYRLPVFRVEAIDGMVHLWA